MTCDTLKLVRALVGDAAGVEDGVLCVFAGFSACGAAAALDADVFCRSARLVLSDAVGWEGAKAMDGAASWGGA